MTDPHIKDLILKLAEGCPSEPEIPLETPPEPVFDSGLICPACGGTHALREQVEDICAAVCSCGCEFCPPMESIAKRVVLKVTETDRHRRHLLDIPSVSHKTHKRERTGSVGSSRELAHKGSSRELAHKLLTT